MRFPQIAVLLVAILGTPAAAQQTTNPIAQHYRAYREALGRGDLARAEVEATAALEASQLRDGDGGDTPALALNTALVRLGEGRREQALIPAQLAATLASGPHSRLDALVVDIAVKRASLRPGDQSEAELLAALNAAQAHGGLDEYVYDGAADLGAWARRQEHLPVALLAWQIASRASPGESETAILSRAHALIEVGVALFYIDVANAPASLPSRLQPFPLNSTNSPTLYHPNVEILNPLAEAARISYPLAQRVASDGRMTNAQVQFSQASAFYSAELSLLSFANIDPGQRTETGFQRYLILPAHAGQSACYPRVVAQPMPTFPPRERNQAHVGAVMTRLVIDDSGRVSDAHVVATVGGEAFAGAVSRVMGQWRIERMPNSAPQCSMAMTLFAPVTFRFAD